MGEWREWLPTPGGKKARELNRKISGTFSTRVTAGSIRGNPTMAFLKRHLNFYRIHVLCFVFIPLVMSAIFYASNGENHISFVDSLFMVFSCATVTGLNSVLLQSLTLWQQVILFLMMTFGSTSAVSIITIMTRLHFFRQKFESLVVHSSDARHKINVVGDQENDDNQNPFSRDIAHHPTNIPSFNVPQPSKPPKKEKKRRKPAEKLRADMVKRVDIPVRVNQMNVDGWLRDDDNGVPGKVVLPESVEMTPILEGTVFTAEPRQDSDPSHFEDAQRARAPKLSIHIDEPVNHPRRRSSDPFRHTDHVRGVTLDPHSQVQHEPISPQPKFFPRARTIEFRSDPTASDLRLRHNRTHREPTARRFSHSSVNPDIITRRGDPAAETGFGGFPNPIFAAAGFAKRHIPVISNFERALTMPRTTTFASTHSGGGVSFGVERTKPAPYISFDAVVGRNSKFHGLTALQQEELGGVEYRALELLLKIVVGYYFLTQLIAVLILAPWLSHSTQYGPVFYNDTTNLSPTWFVIFQVWSAFSNNGMSLVDASMIPFNDAFLLIVVMCFLILMGNTAFPIFLRLLIWTICKFVPLQSRTRETLQFLLDHPRRCFIYLFPSYQTWFLVFVLVLLNSIDWLSFEILDIGNPAIADIPVGVRIINGLFQSFAVRAAGFTIVTLSETSPAVQLLFVVMMYIAVYPIALSVRSTNVYEEKSLGVYEDDDDESEVEERFNRDKTKSSSSYLAYHARKQLAFDLWWLVLAIWLLCIIERSSINDGNSPWVTIFSLLFEVSSAYGTVGLSLGTPTQNTSLSGVLKTLSKLVLIIVMIRGRHRSLPLALDRSILLPSDLVKHKDDATQSFVDADVDGEDVDGEDVDGEAVGETPSRSEEASIAEESPVVR